MATIPDERAKLVAGQAAQLRDSAGRARELLRQRRYEELAVLIDKNFLCANAIWHELDLLTRPPRELPIPGKSRR